MDRVFPTWIEGCAAPSCFAGTFYNSFIFTHRANTRSMVRGESAAAAESRLWRPHVRTRPAGMSFPLEVHLVHMSEDGALAVVGVLFP